MFSIAHNLYSLCAKHGDNRFTALVLGIDHAGKTTLVSSLKGDITDIESSVPTFGMKRVLIELPCAKINFIDIGGGRNMRNYWKDAFCEAHAVIYVVDSANPERFEEAREMLFESVQHSVLEGKPLLLMMNKRDMPTAVDEGEVAQALYLDELACPTWRTQKCIAILTEDGELDKGVMEGITWLTGAVSRDFSSLDRRVEQDILVQKAKEEAEKQRKKEERRRRMEEREAAEAAQQQQLVAAPMGAPTCLEAGEVAIKVNTLSAAKEAVPGAVGSPTKEPSPATALAAQQSGPRDGQEAGERAAQAPATEPTTPGEPVAGMEVGVEAQARAAPPALPLPLPLLSPAVEAGTRMELRSPPNLAGVFEDDTGDLPGGMPEAMEEASPLISSPEKNAKWKHRAWKDDN